MAVVPWNTIDGTTSPFVQIFDSVGVHAAAGILNFVCLTAVMSVYNSGLYANSRMLYSLARQGNAPEILGKLNFHGVPVVGVLASAAITALAVVVVFLWPDFAFNYLMSIATIAGVINWSMIMVQLSRRRHRRCGVACDSADRIPGHADAQDRPPLVAHIPRMEPWPPHARTEPAHHNPTRRTQVTTKSPQTLRSAIFLGLARDHLSRTREYRRKPGKGLTSRPCWRR